MIIGITGTNGSGKDTVADILVKKLGWPHFSLSDELRGICKETHIKSTRDNLIKFGREIRNKKGLDYLSQKVLSKVSDNFIATSIRNLAEIEPFKKSAKFILIAVNAPIEVRYQRVINASKDRSGYKVGEGSVSLGKFRDKEQIEMQGTGRADQQLQILIDMADAKIENGGTMEELENKVDKLLEEIIK